MAFELITFRSDGGETRVANASTDDVLRAVDLIRNEAAYLVDLVNVGTDDVLQIVEVERRCVGVVRIAADGRHRPLFSTSTELADDDIRRICAAFLAGGRVDDIGIEFDAVDWLDRPDTNAAIAQPDLPAPADDEELDPHEALAASLEGAFHKDALLDAIKAGAALDKFGPVPPLVYLACHGGDPAAIECLLELGEQLDAPHAGATALWHALQHSHYTFADELVACGADRSEALSHPHFARWEKRCARLTILDQVGEGNTAAVKRYLHGRHARHVSKDLLVRAIECDQVHVLQQLLAHKGRIALNDVHSESIWGRALQKSDTRFLQLLIDHGGYDGVAAMPGYGGREFLQATPEAIAFLFASGHTAGLHRALNTIIDSDRRAAGSQLAAFPDRYFSDLSGQRQARVLLYFQRYAPWRVDMLLNQNDFAQLVGALVRETSYDMVFRALPRAFGIDSVGPDQDAVFYIDTAPYRQDIRRELHDMAFAIWQS